jgi:transcriptional regulator with XRE-family HTH domain
MANISFGERVRRARIRNAWSQGELAKKLDISAPTISNWELGKSSPGKPEKAKVRKLLGMDAASGSSTSGAKEKGAGDADLEGQGPSAFGAWLNRTRLDKGLSVSELAEQANVSVPQLYNLESGRSTNPRSETVRRIERALGAEVPGETKAEVKEESNIEGLGEFSDFDPHNGEDLPPSSGVYVLYDISERPVYVGEGGNIGKRIRDHSEKFWFKQPIVDAAAYIPIEDERLRKQVEKILIRFLKSNAVLNKQNVDR